MTQFDLLHYYKYSVRRDAEPSSLACVEMEPLRLLTVDRSSVRSSDGMFLEELLTDIRALVWRGKRDAFETRDCSFVFTAHSEPGNPIFGCFKLLNLKNVFQSAWKSAGSN